MQLRKKYYKLIFRRAFTTGMDEYDRNLAYVSINTAQKIFNMNDKVSGYIINSDVKTGLINDSLRENFFAINLANSYLLICTESPQWMIPSRSFTIERSIMSDIDFVQVGLLN